MAQTARSTTRRTVIAAAGAAGLSAALVACGDDSDDKAGSSTPAGSQRSGATQQETGTGGGDQAGGGRELGSAADIPEGGGKIYNDEIVVTQPAKGQYQAFSAICTHQGCPVTSVEGGTINCACHGSKFRIDDGSVAAGPATKPLEAKTVTVENGSVRVA